MNVSYADRHLLYESLVKDLDLKKLNETYSPDCFGNYTVTFSAKEFLIQYNSDRSQLFVLLASNWRPTKWYYSSVIENFINKAAKINVEDPNNFSLISVLIANDFIKNNFVKIDELLNQDNHRNTRKQIEAKLLEEFKADFPGAYEE